MSERDPRVDPRAGDAAQSRDDYIMRDVLRTLTERGVTYVVWRRQFGWKKYRMTLQTWRRKYKGAECVYPAEGKAL